jgi:hypothetical protein
MNITARFEQAVIAPGKPVKLIFSASKHDLRTKNGFDELSTWQEGNTLQLKIFSLQPELDLDEPGDSAEEPGNVQLTSMDMLQPRDVFRFNDPESHRMLVTQLAGDDSLCVAYWDAAEKSVQMIELSIDPEEMIQILDAPTIERLLVGDTICTKPGYESLADHPATAVITRINRNESGIPVSIDCKQGTVPAEIINEKYVLAPQNS